MRNLQISLLPSPPVGTLPVEIVERKGLGHPDTICDALAERLSTALCRLYREEFGVVLHHNVDKGLLFAGRSRPAFGGGEVDEPMEITLAGRAVTEYKGKKLPVEELAVEEARAWFREHFHALDPDRHLRVQCRIRPGSRELVELFLREARTGVALANDTSCGVGYAPLDDLETVVLQVERYLNSPDFKAKHPAAGEDVKVMGVRRGDRISLTVACAFVDRFVENAGDYLQQKEELQALVQVYAESLTAHAVSVEVNTADHPGEGDLYLTVTGTSGEAGDDGQVGRGNRANGLITPNRPMVMEAAAGKNPLTHVGKIYNVAAGRVARRLVKEIPEVREAYCFMVSRIGRPVDEPQVMEVKLRLPEIGLLAEVMPRAREVVEGELAGAWSLWEAQAAGRIAVY
ncbi:methionine adenosyltransferase [Dissulfurirhabdus thermomarina]|uniref:Methionine adenosyltransferase n=1 Tax=Dissulfurirhabdus thermomarina TaxID=1765737 RepID=A0A6N9TUS3_DISTH|nr:methionine adenosyltransferase [Dissulfurirhabdus thermomarina]NMX22987.1 methionine adenosyltransferase [Dissulfurirhabdus thermomarina]